MIRYEETVEIKVFLNNRLVGNIVGSRSTGWRYKPKGGSAGALFDSIDEVKRSIEGE